MQREDGGRLECGGRDGVASGVAVWIHFEGRTSHRRMRCCSLSHPLGYRDIPFSVHGLSLKGPDLVSIANQQIPLEQTLSFFTRSLCAKFPTVNVLICLFVLGGWTHTDIELFTLPTQGRSLVSCAFPFRPVCTLPILSPWFNV